MGILSGLYGNFEDDGEPDFVLTAAERQAAEKEAAVWQKKLVEELQPADNARARAWAESVVAFVEANPQPKASLHKAIEALLDDFPEHSTGQLREMVTSIKLGVYEYSRECLYLLRVEEEAARHAKARAAWEKELAGYRLDVLRVIREYGCESRQEVYDRLGMYGVVYHRKMVKHLPELVRMPEVSQRKKDALLMVMKSLRERER